MHVPASLFADFEDSRMGTFGWTIRGAPDPRDGDFSATSGNGEEDENSTTTAPRGGHFDPRNFSSLGPRVSVEVSEARSVKVCSWATP